MRDGESTADVLAKHAKCVRSYRTAADKLAVLEQSIRRIHPERMTEHDWRDMRADLLAVIAATRELHLSTADLLEKLGGGHEYDHSGRDYPAET